jgi:hypothetical protein
MTQADTDEFGPALPSKSHQARRIGRSKRTEISVMESQQVERHEAAASKGRRACLVEGCTCKDARIVSHRRAAFFSAWAKDHGETANRIIRPDPSWNFLFNSTSAA